MKVQDLIKKYEGYRVNAYLCPAGVPTIGYGHTAGVKMGDQVTQTQANAYLDEDIKEAEDGIKRYVIVPLTENQMGALISFVFNLGIGNFAKSTLLKLLNEGKYTEASQQFDRWNKVNGIISTGLTNRRLAEKQFFNTP